MSATKYFTIHSLEDYLDRIWRSSGMRLSIQDALFRMDEDGLLLTEAVAFPALDYRMDHENFCRAYSSFPLSIGYLLDLPSSEWLSFADQEAAAFPPGLDVFTRKMIIGTQERVRCTEYLNIYFVEAGGCTMDFSGDAIELKTGDMCILPPRSPHKVSLTGSSFVWDILIRSSNFDSRFGELMTMSGVFSGFFRDSMYGQSQPNFLLMHTSVKDNDLLVRLRALVTECVLPMDNHTNSCATSLMKLLLASALRSCGDEVNIHHFPTGGNPRADCGEILQYIRQNSRTVRLSTLAKEFHYNETYLSRMLQNYAHQSFTEIVRDIRMNRAEEYLTNSSLRVHEIAGMVGYSSVDHFSRAFKALYGVSPQGYRRKHRK